MPKRAGPGGRNQLVIMAKEPVAGRVKTRLSKDIGVAAATNFYRHTLHAVTTRLASDPRWHTSLSVAPAEALRTTALSASIDRLPQSTGDVGRRMQAIFGLTGALPAKARPGRVVIIGTDIPEVRPAHIASAFKALDHHAVVFGPAADGGFWLVGMRRIPRIIEAFPDVRWSSPHTLRDCLAALSATRTTTITTLQDVDNLSDLRSLNHDPGRLILCPQSNKSPENQG